MEKMRGGVAILQRKGGFWGAERFYWGFLQGAGEKTGDGKIDKAAGESLWELAREGGRARRAGRRRRPKGGGRRPPPKPGRSPGCPAGPVLRLAGGSKGPPRRAALALGFGFLK